MLQKILFSVCLFLPLALSAQIVTGGDSFEDKVDSSLIRPWITKLIDEYQGVYHFGFSDGEFDFILIVTKDSLYGQIHKAFWQKIGDKWDRIPSYQNLSNVKILGNKFFSDQSNGAFVTYEKYTKNKNGLIAYNPFRQLSKKGLSDFGFYSHKLEIHFAGRFPEASWRLLNLPELKSMTQSDLEIMANEIYARYGYNFKPDSAMEKYFKLQEWYKPRFINVDSFLTGLEKRNYSLIISYLNKK